MLMTLLFFLPTALFFAMIPGPDFALILRISLLEGRQSGLAAAVGIGAGLSVHTALSVLGLSAIIVHSPPLFTALKYGGAAYLAFLGFQALRSSPAASSARDGEDDTSRPDTGATACKQQDKAGKSSTGFRSAFRQGFLTNVLNPKAVLFFLTFLPQFLNEQTAISANTQLLVLGAGMCLVTCAWFLALSLLLGKLKRLFTNEFFRRWLERITGIIFIGFGAKLALTT